MWRLMIAIPAPWSGWAVAEQQFGPGGLAGCDMTRCTLSSYLDGCVDAQGTSAERSPCQQATWWDCRFCVLKFVFSSRVRFLACCACVLNQYCSGVPETLLLLLLLPLLLRAWLVPRPTTWPSCATGCLPSSVALHVCF
jgi:hypothetical protein